MPDVHSSCDRRFVYGLLPALPVILGGLVISWQGTMTVYGALLALFLVLCGIGSGFFLWHRHIKALELINSRWAQEESNKLGAVSTYTAELERLLLTITPILSQHVMVSREHTEQEITSLSGRFAGMVNELQTIVDSTDNTLGGQHYHLDNVMNTSRDLLHPVLELLRRIHQIEQDVVDDAALFQAEADINRMLSNLSLAFTHYRSDIDALRNNAEQIRGEINNVLVALQFQDRVSQILTQVENNLLNLQETIEKIQLQGSNRDGNMIQVDEAVEHIEENYKSVSSSPNRERDSADDLTFF